MLKSFKNGILTLAVLATTVSGFAQPAEARNYFNPYNGYYPQATYVNPYYSNSYGYGNQFYYRRPSIIKPALVGAGIGAGVGAGVSLLSDNDGHSSRHFVRNMGIGAGVGAGVGALTGLIRRSNRYYY